LLFGKKYRENWPCVSIQIQPHDVVGATDWLKLRAGAMKGADADTVTEGVGVAIIKTKGAATGVCSLHLL